MIKLRTCVIFVIVAILGTCLLSGWPVHWYYTRMRGADQLIARTERIKQIKSIHESLCAFHRKHGRFPNSQTEWASEEPNLSRLLQAPRWSRDRGYTVHFERLGTFVPQDIFDERQLLIEDPGLFWPGEPNSWSDPWRVGLTSDGRLVSYSIVLPIHEEPLSCP